MEDGAEFGIKPIGLGARDTLRLEAALHLYGNDLDENTTPIEAGLSWSVPKDKEVDYNGKDVIMEQIKNPVLPGFNADPSIIRVDDTYYIANSTFEWFPGVRLHESKDMVHWKLLPSALSTTTLLERKSVIGRYLGTGSFLCGW